MKPRLVMLSLLLLAAIGAVIWQARVRWEEAQALRRTNLNVTVKRIAPPPLAPAPKPDAPPATKYADVAMKDLFSKDRNPTVVIEAPKVVVAPPRPMPPLPIVYGVLGLPSGTKAIMAEKSGAPSKPVHQGDNIGEFKILALDTQDVKFEWDGKPVERKIEDLMDRTSRAGAAGPPPAAGAAPGSFLAPPQQQQQNQQQPAPGNPPPANALGGSPVGAELGAPGHSERACNSADPSPVGTVIDGYKKVSNQTLFGPNCRWVPAQ